MNYTIHKDGSITFHEDVSVYINDNGETVFKMSETGTKGHTNVYCGGKFVGRYDESGYRTAEQVKALDDQQEGV